MRISTNTASCITSRGCTQLLDEVQALHKLHDAGYDTLDLSLVFQNRPDFFLHAPDWEARVEALGLAAEELGITFNQCHYPFLILKNDLYKRPGYEEMFREVSRRAVLAAGMLKIPHGVVHPVTYAHLNHEKKACMEQNHANLDWIVELGIRQGVRTAIENMPPLLDQSYPMRFGMHYEDVIELADSYQEPRWVGICWDTGHGNLARLDQARALHCVGSRLMALHVNDNKGQLEDEHLIPYLGTVDWPKVLQALIDIGYPGDLTYETGQFSKNAPAGPIQDSLLKAMYENGRGLLRMYDDLKAASGK